MRRRWFVLGGAALVAGAGGWWALGRGRGPEIGFTLSEDQLQRARRLMAAHPVIDAHAHPGRTFLRDGRDFADWKIWLYALFTAGFEDDAVADMKAGGVDAAVWNGVADVQILKLGDGGLTPARDFAPGEAWASYERQIANLAALEKEGLVQICRTPEDVLAAKTAGRRGAILGMEGADFLENDLSRLDRVHADGVRMLTLVHYHDNTIAPTMTGAMRKGRLTDFGRAVVARCNELGIMIDGSHAAESAVADMIAASRAPVVLTHTHVRTPELDHPRFVDPALARQVAEAGGYIGAWPAGIGQTSLREFVDRILWLIEKIGPEHVAIGSDMDANYKPVLETYRKFPLVVGALLARGLDEKVVAEVMGGNFLRVWRKTVAAAGS